MELSVMVSVFLWHEPPTPQRRLVVILVLSGARWDCHLLPGHFVVWDQTQEMRNAVQTRAALVVRAHDVPRRLGRVGDLQHAVARPRVVVPAPPRFQVGGTQLPLPQWVLNPRLEPPFLFLVADLEPEFDQLNPTLNNVLFNLWAQLEEMTILLRCAEPHDMLDASAVVPTAVKNDDLTSGREMRHIALHVHLALLSVRRRLQGHNAEDTGADAFGDRLDGAALAGSVAPFEDDDHPQALVFHPVLEMQSSACSRSNSFS